MRRVVAVQALGGYRLRVVFDDGVAGDIDLTARVGRGVYAAWADPVFFRSVRIGDLGELAWSDAIDLCPDALYLDVTGRKAEDLFPALRTPEAAAHA